MDVKQLIIGFINKYNHNIPLTWFDIEMQTVTGIDVYQYDFPKQKGYQVIDNHPYHLLILKHDLSDDMKIKHISEFPGIEPFHLLNLNRGTSKEYAKEYKEFLNSIKFSSEYVNKMLMSKYAKHFYSVEELHMLSQRWTQYTK